MLKEEREVLDYSVQMSPHHVGGFKKAVRALVRAVRAEERERCAKMAAELSSLRAERDRLREAFDAACAKLLEVPRSLGYDFAVRYLRKRAYGEGE